MKLKEQMRICIEKDNRTISGGRKSNWQLRLITSATGKNSANNKDNITLTKNISQSLKDKDNLKLMS